MPQNQNDPNHVYANHIVLPVIASFDTKGNVHPLYVRINGEAYKVCTSWEKPSFAFTSVFQCQIADHGVLKTLMLTYHHKDRIWLMEKWEQRQQS